MKKTMINNAMKKILIGLIVFCGVGLIPAGFAAAQGIVDISFENEPDALFQQINFLPGESTGGWIKVKNISGETQKIGVEIIDKLDPLCQENCLSDKLNLVITEGENGTSLTTGSLTTFYEEGGIYLSDLGIGENTVYYFSISFNPMADDDYQGSEAKFDIKIGTFGEESISGEIIPGGGSSGGGGIFIAGLRILDESVPDISDYSVTVTWLTTSESTSRVIYSPEGFPHILKLNNPPKYGYAFSKEGDDSKNEKVVAHSVTIAGLLPGTTYYFRCISHASPDTIGFEHSFTTTLPEGVTVPEEEPGEEVEDVQKTAEEEIKKEIDGGVYETEDAEGLVLGETTEIEEARDTDQSDDEEPEQKKDEETVEEEEGNDRTGLLAAISNTFGSFGSCVSCFPWLCLLLFMIAPLMKLWAVLEKRDRTTNSALKKHYKRIATVWAIAFLAPASLTAWAYFANHHCVHIIYFWIFALLTVLSWWFDIRKTTMDIETLDNDDHQQTITKKQKLLLYAMFITLAIVLAIWLIFGCAPIWLILALLAVNVVLRLFVKK